ncbi:MAG: response regulator transcription factor [Alphaproteobacteria bacterium]|nr:response regulator transcription factor [Alphaproteobacteria bacterium]
MKGRKITENKTRILTPRQFTVLTFLAAGLRNKEIAYRMGLTVSTVKQHISGIMLRLNVNTRTAVVLKAQKLGLIDPE